MLYPSIFFAVVNRLVVVVVRDAFEVCTIVVRNVRVCDDEERRAGSDATRNGGSISGKIPLTFPRFLAVNPHAASGTRS